jgi:uncharacterized protein YbjQ (UPF0145 family)
MFQFGLFIALLALGYFAGQMAERKHYQSIQAREKTLIGLPAINSKRPMGELPTITDVRLVQGNVVISVDYFKRIQATLRSIFGGNVMAYETLVDRARREAILRLKESCPGANQVINLRIETSSITKGNANQIGAVEVLAYATAIYT